MTKKIIMFVISTITAIAVICISAFCLLKLILDSIFNPICAREKLETILSPNNEYKIITYRENCGGATVDFAVVGELCTKDNKCREIYDCYHEQDSYVYWIDDKTFSINNKILKINKEKYSWKNDPGYYDKRYIKE